MAGLADAGDWASCLPALWAGLFSHIRMGKGLQPQHRVLISPLGCESHFLSFTPPSVFAWLICLEENNGFLCFHSPCPSYSLPKAKRSDSRLGEASGPNPSDNRKYVTQACEPCRLRHSKAGQPPMMKMRLNPCSSAMANSLSVKPAPNVESHVRLPMSIDDEASSRNRRPML